MFFAPTFLWDATDPCDMREVTSSWQFRGPEVNEPSDSAFAFQRPTTIVALLIMVGGVFSVMSVSHRNASDHATDNTTPHVYPDIYSLSDGGDSGGYAETTVTPSPTDPLPLFSMTTIGSGGPVILFKSVFEGTASE